MEVFNLSALNVEAGSSSYGGVARYAIVVYTSEDDAPQKATVEKNGYTVEMFQYNQKWYVYAVEQPPITGLLYIPESVDGTSIVECIIDERALNNLSFSGIVIPYCVKDLASVRSYLQYGKTIYYGSTMDEWLALTSNDAYYSSVLYYVDCVHESGTWSYDESGNVTTQIPARTSEVVEDPTCMTVGKLEESCNSCGYVWEYEIEKTDLHTPDEDGVCSNCGVTVEVLTSETLETLSYLTNDTTYPFVISDDGVLSSVNEMVGSTASFKVTAEQDMTVRFDYLVSIAAYGDRFVVLLNGVQQLSCSASVNTEAHASFELSEGDVLTIRFTRGNYSTTQDVGVNITNMQFVFGDQSVDII